MSTVIFVTVVLMFAGGFIAYWGDRLGYDLGKKRLSLFGMRPRRTASFLTVVAGVVIAVLTFGILLSISKGFRVALVGAQALLEQNHRVKQDNRMLRTQNRALTAQVPLLQQKADLARAQEVSEAARERQAQGKLANTQAQLAARQLQLQAAGQKLQTVNRELQVAQTSLSEARQKVALLQRREGVLKSFASAMDESLKQGAENPMIYANGAEVWRTRIGARQPQWAIRKEIVNFLNEASIQAEQKGAAIGANHRAVVIASIHLKGTSTFFQENDSVQALADQIHAWHGSSSVVVIAKAWGNAFANRPVIVRLQPYGNFLIPAGTVLGSIKIPQGQKGVEEILSDITSLVDRDVREAAIHRGLIPVVTDPSTHQAQTGGVDPDEFDPAVDAIQDTSGDVWLVATAKDNTWSWQPLKIHLSVYKAPPGQTASAQAPAH